MTYTSLAPLVPKLRRTSQFVTQDYEDSLLLDFLIDAFPKVMTDIKGEIAVDENGNLSSSIDDKVAALVVARAAVFVLKDKASQLATQAVKIKSGQQQVDITNTASQVREVVAQVRDEYTFMLEQYLKSKKASPNSLVLKKFKKYDL